MKAECFTYEIGEKINLKKLSKLSYFEKGYDENVLLTEVKGLKVKVFPSGKIRVFYPGKSFEEIKDLLLTASVEIYSIIEDIIRITGVKVSSKQVIANGYREELGGVEEELRKKEGTKVDLEVLRNMFFAIYDISGDFQAERISTQAGELVGRRIVRVNSPSSKEELLKLIKRVFLEKGLGVVEEMKPEKSAITIEAVLRVKECAFCSGVAPVNKKLCNFSRGLIRGAFAEFKKMESVTVNETKCWGMGDDYCEFEVYSLAR